MADPELIETTARRLNLDNPVNQVGEEKPVGQDGALNLLPVELAVPVKPGTPEKAAAPYVLATLRKAAALCLTRQAAGLVTGPIHKGIINDAGIRFSGHTEFLAAEAGIDRVVMMLIAGELRVALTTTHLPLKDVATAITRDRLRKTLKILHADLDKRFGLNDPTILVLGLNPHAGEDGHLGREEKDIIEPIMKELRNQGMTLKGPAPADTAFLPEAMEGVDAVLAMYHDQGLPVLKYAGFGKAVNVTLGLPFIRTSVDHGTAMNIAGTGKADPGSLEAAIELAGTLQP